MDGRLDGWIDSPQLHAMYLFGQTGGKGHAQPAQTAELSDWMRCVGGTIASSAKLARLFASCFCSCFSCLSLGLSGCRAMAAAMAVMMVDSIRWSCSICTAGGGVSMQLHSIGGAMIRDFDQMALRHLHTAGRMLGQPGHVAWGGGRMW